MLLCTDVDGTLTEVSSGNDFAVTPKDYRLKPGVFEKLTSFVDSEEWSVMCVSNQGGIHRGFKTLDTCVEEQKFKLSLLGGLVDSILICPDGGKTCIRVTRDKHEKILADKPVGFRKPEPGMIFAAMDICCESSEGTLYVGDRPEDKIAAKRAGVDFMWAHKWLIFDFFEG